MQPWTKEIITKAIKANKSIKIVDTIDEVEKYCNQKMYAIEKNSPILKGLIQEGVFPIDQRFLKLQKGYYYIINIISQSIEIKSESKILNIGIVAYKDAENSEYWNKLYQVKLDPLFNFVSERKFTNAYNPHELIGRTICIESFNLNEEKKSYEVVWYDLQSQEKYIAKLEEIYTEQMNAMEDAMEEKYMNSEVYYLAQWESEQEEDYLDEDNYQDDFIDFEVVLMR
ncbi:hypothetical protein [Dysgonomonas sp. 520]|uniref:hypothetical protein n=1 Tax=Dysgonomonas sp. 520 TaxID=2302931 RepID=UPI0013D2260E|nr:hypothetical protein [Dysgonomonas sp. 520]NDW11261.1 hypothetical protein [Dysgonomonas sp. 520]